MKYPLEVATSKTLKIVDSNFFAGIAKLDLEAGLLEMNVTHEGIADLHWMLDLDGVFYELVSMGLLPLTLLQRTGLSRARERFRIVPGRTIDAQELAGRISGLTDQFEEAPNVSDLKLYLSTLAPDHVLGLEEMSQYQGV